MLKKFTMLLLSFSIILSLTACPSSEHYEVTSDSSVVSESLTKLSNVRDEVKTIPGASIDLHLMANVGSKEYSYIDLDLTSNTVITNAKIGLDDNLDKLSLIEVIKETRLNSHTNFTFGSQLIGNGSKIISTVDLFNDEEYLYLLNKNEYSVLGQKLTNETKNKVGYSKAFEYFEDKLDDEVLPDVSYDDYTDIVDDYSVEELVKIFKLEIISVDKDIVFSGHISYSEIIDLLYKHYIDDVANDLTEEQKVIALESFNKLKEYNSTAELSFKFGFNKKYGLLSLVEFNISSIVKDILNASGIATIEKCELSFNLNIDYAKQKIAENDTQGYSEYNF